MHKTSVLFLLSLAIAEMRDHSLNNISLVASSETNQTFDTFVTAFIVPSNYSSVVFQSSHAFQPLIRVGVALILCALTVATAVGNIFVIAAIWMDKNLQSAQNCLVLSLAMADLMVALLVMPLATAYNVQQRWLLGSELCTFWTLVDVFSCTASILHLLAIALDRYWSVSSLHYSQRRSTNRMLYTIAAVWIAAAVVSMPPIFGAKDPEFEFRIKNGRCMVSQDVGYQIFATISTFYAPSFFILLLYWKIYKVARKRIRNKPGFGASGRHRTSELTANRGTISGIRDEITNCSSMSERIRSRASTLSVDQRSSSPVDLAVVEHSSSSTSVTKAQPLTPIKRIRKGKRYRVRSSEPSVITPAFSRTKDIDENKTVQKQPSMLDSSVDKCQTADVANSSSNYHQLNVDDLVSSQARSLQVPGEKSTRTEGLKNVCRVQSDTSDSNNNVMSTLEPSERSKSSCSTSRSVASTITKQSKTAAQNLAARKERKTAKILAIITGVFIICWLPFFVIVPLMAINPNQISDQLFSIFLWLGYVNSLLNPIIYTIFSPDFRNAFKRLFTRCRSP